MSIEQQIAIKVAKLYEGCDWHQLRSIEQQIIFDLEKGGYIAIKPRPDGFVGKAVLPEEQADPLCR